MGKIAELVLQGASESKYTFNVYTADTGFNDIGAVYAFTKRKVENDKVSHDVLYVGETEELGSRISGHDKWPCAKKYGGNCICVHSESNENDRLKKETDLIKNYEPVCNG